MSQSNMVKSMATIAIALLVGCSSRTMIKLDSPEDTVKSMASAAQNRDRSGFMKCFAVERMQRPLLAASYEIFVAQNRFEMVMTEVFGEEAIDELSRYNVNIDSITPIMTEELKFAVRGNTAIGISPPVDDMPLVKLDEQWLIDLRSQYTGKEQIDEMVNHLRGSARVFDILTKEARNEGMTVRQIADSFGWKMMMLLHHGRLD